MNRYDPSIAPDAAGWLALGEEERVALVEKFHRKAGLKAPSPKMHAAVHVIVENQLADPTLQPVRDTLERLMREGLNRHDAIHAIGMPIAGFLFEAQKPGGRPFDLEKYYADLRSLTAENWQRFLDD